MTADEFQQHMWILKQPVRQRQSLQKKKDPACQSEKSLGYLKTVKSLFVFPWHFRIKHHLHINSCASDVLAPAAAAPSDVVSVLHQNGSGYLTVTIIRGECQLHLAENPEKIGSHDCSQEMSER
ncbi:hypothetical protein PoB_005354900 [Plakobranchus ocellatus]|uniref:Uncharacterized protein n=1 Tax=Plakobranchus ocellatus TaxID=259542 RepID=A0AAV4C8L2_9GAST|nr:hypothetical protein PoB_005354900 [Plakobranchus ocellatus]